MEMVTILMKRLLNPVLNPTRKPRFVDPPHDFEQPTKMRLCITEYVVSRS